MEIGRRKQKKKSQPEVSHRSIPKGLESDRVRVGMQADALRHAVQLMHAVHAPCLAEAIRNEGAGSTLYPARCY